MDLSVSNDRKESSDSLIDLVPTSIMHIYANFWIVDIKRRAHTARSLDYSETNNGRR